MQAGGDYVKGKANELMDKGREKLVEKMPDSMKDFSNNLLKTGQDSLNNKLNTAHQAA